MHRIGRQLVINTSLIFFGAFSVFSQKDTLFYKGFAAVEMSNGTKNDFVMVDDEIYRNYGCMLSIDSSKMKPLYSDNFLFFQYDENLDSLIENNSLSTDVGNLLIILNNKLSKDKTNVESCFFYLLFDVELYYINTEDNSLIVPNLYKKKRN
jgi:hypothetical protein